MCRGVLPETLHVCQFIIQSSSQHVEVSEEQFHFQLCFYDTQYPHLPHVQVSSELYFCFHCATVLQGHKEASTVINQLLTFYETVRKTRQWNACLKCSFSWKSLNIIWSDPLKDLFRSTQDSEETTDYMPNTGSTNFCKFTQCNLTWILDLR